MARRFIKLTRPAVRALQPGQKITEHGIEALREANGDLRWSIAVMVRGQRIHRVVGRESDKTNRSDAEDALDAIVAEAKAGRLNLPKGRAAPLTVAKAAELYLAGLEKTGGRNLANKRQHIALHIKPAIGKVQLDRLSAFTLANFRKTILDKGRSVATANRVASTFNHMATWLLENDKIDAPLRRMKKTDENNRRDWIFSDADEAAILDAAARDPYPYIWLFIRMGFGTGMRHSEILSARFDRLDVARRRLRVKVKGGRWREQPLPQWLVDLLREERESAADPDGWIFPSAHARSGHITQVSKPFRRCAIAAGLDPARATPHAMRHTAISRFSAAVHGDAAMVQRFSGHLSVQMVLRYTHPADERIDQALDTIAAGARNF